MIRPASAIGQGLAPAREARRIVSGESVHVVGVAGAGASAAALLAAAAGARVSGCDAGGPSPYTGALDAAGIPMAWAHDPAHVGSGPGRPARLAVTKALTSVDPDHPELVAARRAGIPVEPWQQLVADAAADRTLVAVAGTHGKSTTAGWLVHLLVGAGADPAAFVGALLPASLTGGPPATARLGAGQLFVVEADEYAGNFDPFRPAVAIVTSIDWDHPDVFGNLDAVVTAFESWLRASGAGTTRPVLVANVGDPGVRLLLQRLGGWPGSVLAVALADPQDPGLADAAELGRALRAEGLTLATAAGGILVGRLVGADPASTTIEVAGLGNGGRGARIRLATAGRHNAENALAVAAAALYLGLTPGQVRRGLATFGGVGRRLERKGSAAGVTVYDDYGHHPAAIRATLRAVRQREPGHPVWAVYEPLTFHRTAALLDGFAAALAEADAVAIADIWAGRDPDTTVASAAGLAAAVAAQRPGLTAVAPGSVEATGDWLSSAVRPGDVVLVMGGGASYRIGERLLERLGAG
jgi:UDP-N-acetylmuramate--alanine ligase